MCARCAATLGRAITSDSRVSAGVELGRYTYDGARRLTSVRRPGRPALSYLYDASGRPTSAGSATTWARLTYVTGTTRPATSQRAAGRRTRSRTMARCRRW